MHSARAVIGDTTINSNQLQYRSSTDFCGNEETRVTREKLVGV